MIQSPLQRQDLEFVARNMRAASRHEVFACRKDDSVEKLIAELLEIGSPHQWSFGLDEPIYVGGIYEDTPGHWLSWGFATDRFDEIAIPLTKAIRRDILLPLLERGFTCLETCGLGGYPDIARWMKFLGAKQHAIAHGYGKNGEDVIVYRWEPGDVLRRR